MHPRAIELIQTLGLQPHPEGGHYREIFRAPSLVEPCDSRGSRSAVTQVYYLLAAGERSCWHRIQSDEIWHFYGGDPLELLSLDGATCERMVLGPCTPTSQPALAIPAGHWQAARTLGHFTLVGCTVGPGFEFSDFEMMRDAGDASITLRAQFPDLAWML